MKTVAEFKIQYRQILDPSGAAVAPLPQFALDTDEVLRMYRAMTQVRVFDAKSVNLQRTGQLGTYPSSLGHEAAHVGIGAAMRRRMCSPPCTANSALSCGAASP
jgi:pyruvate dehydrogenase E1 component alpha subunit